MVVNKPNPKLIMAQTIMKHYRNYWEQWDAIIALDLNAILWNYVRTTPFDSIEEAEQYIIDHVSK